METNELIPSSTLKELDDYNNKASVAAKTTEILLVEAQKLTAEFNKSGNSIKAINDLIGKHNDLEGKLAKTQSELSKAHQEIEAIRKKAIETNSKEVELIRESTKARNENTKAINDNAKSLKDISEEAYNLAKKSNRQLREDHLKLNLAIEATRNRIKELDKSYKDGNVTQQSYLNLKGQLINTEQIQSKKSKELGDIIKYNNQIISTSIGSYDNLSAQYSRLKIQINQMSEAEKFNGYTKAELQKQSEALYEQMSKEQKLTGKHQLDVGKYDLAVKDLTKTLSIIDPRIGMLITKAQQITPLKNAWLKVNNQLTTSLGMSAKAATIMQAAVLGLVVGGILLAVSSIKKWYEEERRSRQSFEDLNNVMVRSAESSSNTIVSFESLRRKWNELADDVDAKKRFILENKSAFDTLGVGVNTVTDAENIFVNNTDAVLKAIRLRAEANILAEIASEKYKESVKKMKETEERYMNPTFWESLLDNTNALGDGMLTVFDNILGGSRTAKTATDFAINASREQFGEAKKAAEEYNKAIDLQLAKEKEAIDLLKTSGIMTSSEAESQRKAAEERAKSAKKRIEEEAKTASDEKKALQELAEFRIEQNAEAYKKELLDTKLSYEERMTAVNEYENKLGESILKKRDQQLDNEELTTSQRILIEEKAQAELNKISEEGGKYREQIVKDYVEKQQETITSSYKERTRRFEASQEEELSLLAEMLSTGAITQEEYEKRKTDLTKEHAKERFDAEVESLRAILDIAGISAEERSNIEKQILDAELAYNRSINSQKIKEQEDYAKKMVDIEKNMSDERKKLVDDLYKQSFELMNTIFEAQTERNMQKLDKEREDNDKWREEEFEKIERLEESGAISKEQADARKAAVDYQAQEREEEIEQKQKQLQIDQAKREKAIKLLQIGIETAQAVARIKAATSIGIMSAMATSPLTGGLPWSATITAAGASNIALTIASGAVQAAIIAAQEIPAYKHGTDSHKGGPAIVGDGGRAEMVITPSGEIYKTPSVPTLMNLPKETMVLPDFQKALYAMSFTPLARKSDEGTTIFESVKQIEAMKENTKETIKMHNSVSRGLEAVQREVIKGNNSFVRSSKLSKRKNRS